MMNKKVISLIREMKDDYNYNESIKTLRTNIQFCGSNIHTIMFTSAMPDEGKSDVAFAAASSLAQIGKHVVFIDADIRKSVLVSRYQLTEEVSGLSQYLSGQKGMKEILYDTNLENLSVIFAGPYSPNPAELLEEKLAQRSQAMEIHKVLHRLSEPYKEVFSLRTFGELKFSEIGMLFGKSENWARVTYYRARVKIREELEQ